MICLKTAKAKGRVMVEPSKSMMQRAVAAALLCDGRSCLRNISLCDDCVAGMDVASSLGAEVSTPANNSVLITGGLKAPSRELCCGEAGLCIRMYTPIAALLDTEVTLTGSGGLTKRPMSMAESPLRALGARVSTNNGLLPITVKGPLKGGEVTLDASMSSQLLSGLLIACARARHDSVINVSSLASKPYIDMTLQVMDAFGIEYGREGYTRFIVPGGQKYQSRDYTVEGDWSGAAFVLAAGALGGPVTAAGLRTDTKQADIAVLQAIEAAGANIDIDADAGEITASRGRLKGFSFDATECPDLFPPLTALAAHCDGVSEITGVSRLRHKESDRAAVLQEQFGRLGVEISLKNNTMYIIGGTGTGGRINACGDHRIAMAAAAYACGLEGEMVEIEDPECAAKSWPGFFEQFGKIGIRH
ncbi:3-phosphoshikimate 1-carboxyvinyltransferase [Limihaloglobus sulfuriphilus]|uniref:3-phosphoshikimate 1-carboxyvinyltransferase n=1 Tax=Limihaloglobus sulfuriphilus TaxID=1851148 RepID=A0A1Q2MDI5_9BACT|nr:3-phosphoshikimate 1-carboxyvinyltransferase [Limihaloglobus sulfuriphilus]AQQ70766.1 3-phosphoshikimate 1-carboxyvinyltransferase [Limihaloglobus sulfuriphilus]